MGGRTVGRYGYWFPLVLLGFGLLALLGWDGVRPVEDVGWFAYTAEPPYQISQHFHAVSAFYDSSAMPPFVATVQSWTWPVLITVVVVGTIAWYGWRAGGSVRGHVAVAVGAGAVIWLVHLVAWVADATAGLGEVVPSVGLPLIGLGVLAGAYFRFGRRRLVAVIGAVCLGAGVAVVLGAWAPELLDPVLVAAGLLVLAWYERSRLVAVVACLVLTALLVFPDGTLRMLVPAVVVLAAAIVALARRDSAPVVR